jgi:hypothetical protein
MLTPLHIQILLHYYAIAEPYAKDKPAHANSIATITYTQQLVQHGLIYRNEDSPSGYSSTTCGEAFIERLLATPIAL